jgi:hypothetical protein
VKVLNGWRRGPKPRRFVAGTTRHDDSRANLLSSQNVVYDTARFKNQFFPDHFDVPLSRDPPSTGHPSHEYLYPNEWFDPSHEAGTIHPDEHTAILTQPR